LVASIAKLRIRRSLSQRADVRGPLTAWIATTPGRLQLLAVLIGVAAVAFALVTTTAVLSRRHAAVTVAGQTERVLVQADQLDASLSDADATAVTTFLSGGVEPPASRARYVADLQRAGAQLTTLAQQAGTTGDARAAVTTIAAQLPIYSGLVESARAN